MLSRPKIVRTKNRITEKCPKKFTPNACGPGDRESSTRAEIAAGIIAMAADCESHMGTDSKAFMDRANIILQMIKEQRKPKRLWSIQKDGDLRNLFSEMAQIKGAGSIKISKVKDHATEKNIQDGTSTVKDKIGNDRADRAADQGVKDHAGEICKLSRIQAQRQHKYMKFTKEAHSHILEAFYKRKYMESVEMKETTTDPQQTNRTTPNKFITICEIHYNQEINELTDVGNMGETMSKYKNGF